MKCWICGLDAKTGEHRVKASDLRIYFGRITQQTPIYTHTKERKNIPIRSLKSDRLKSDALICDRCNSALTQPYDRAWEKLSTHLNTNWLQLQKKQKVDLSKVFPESRQKSLLNVHLFFLKLFGCMVVEHAVPIDVKEFSYCLQTQTPHPRVYLAFGQTPGESIKKLAATTPIQAVNDHDRTIFVTWLYIVGNISVNVIYNEVNENNTVLSRTWHPTNASKIIRLKKF